MSSGVLYNSLGVLVVNAGCLLFYLLVRRAARGILDKAFLGYYMVLMPVGLVAWFHPGFISLPFFVLAGLLLLTHQLRGIVARQTGSHRPSPRTSASDEAPEAPRLD
jgi:hypothetical protein